VLAGFGQAPLVAIERALGVEIRQGITNEADVGHG
jgi:hypothetical protein